MSHNVRRLLVGRDTRSPSASYGWIVCNLTGTSVRHLQAVLSSPPHSLLRKG